MPLSRGPIDAHRPWLRRLLWTGACWLALLAARPAEAQVTYNITGVKCEQLNNAVRVKIEADGAIQAGVKFWDDYYLNWHLVDQLGWGPEVFPQVDKILFSLTNARSAVGSVADVSHYPVSHVRFINGDWGEGNIALNVEVVLHKRMRLRSFDIGTGEMDWDAYLWDHHDPAWFEFKLSSDRRSMIITVASDRLPDPEQRRSLERIPEAQRQVQAEADGERLRVHARTASLAQVLEAVSKATSVPLSASAEVADRVITAELPETTVEEFTARLADCYGLTRYRNGTTTVLCDPRRQSAGSQAPVEARRFPVHSMKARAAASLLPNFLEDCMRVDEEGNALVVSGPESLLDKVAAEVAEMDQPATAVRVTATFLEAASAQEALSRLGLSYQDEHGRTAARSEEGAVFYSTLGALPEQFTANLQARASQAGLKVSGTTCLTVTNGDTGDLFAGLVKYVAYQRDSEVTIAPVSAGTTLTVTPWAGNEHITMRVRAETKSIAEVDRATGLPVTDTRAAEGTFQVHSGETMVIGGLTETLERKQVRKIPGLGDLPLVGQFFRTKVTQREVTCLTVLLTATIVTAETPAPEPPPRPPVRPRRSGPREVRPWER